MCSGQWVNDKAPRGIVARCSLAFKNARGATCTASGSAVVGTTCTNVGCIVEEIAVALAIGGQWSSVEEYLDIMKLPVKHRRQWGGYSEALLLSYQWNVTVGIFAEGKTGDRFLMCDPIIPPGATDPENRICLLWKGQTHYNLLIMPPRTWAQAQRAAQAG